MKRITLFYALAGLLIAAVPALRAEPAPTNQNSALARRAENQRVMEIVGLNRAELRGLTPEERREKMRTAIEAKITELKQKESNGSISPLEKSDLTLLEKRVHHGKGKKKEKQGNTAPPVPPVQSQQQSPQSQQ